MRECTLRPATEATEAIEAIEAIKATEITFEDPALVGLGWSGSANNDLHGRNKGSFPKIQGRKWTMKMRTNSHAAKSTSTSPRASLGANTNAASRVAVPST